MSKEMDRLVELQEEAIAEGNFGFAEELEREMDELMDGEE